MNYKSVVALAFVGLITTSCGKKKQHDDIIVQETEAPQPQAPIRMQDYKDVKDVQWLGKQYQVEVTRTASDSLAMDNRIVLRVIRQDGTVFCTKTFTKASFTGCLDDDYRKTGILEGFVFDKAEGNQLFFAASVCHPQTDEYIPMVVTVSNFGEVGIAKDQQME